MCGIIINVDIKSETVNNIVDKLSNGTSWLANTMKESITSSSTSIAVRDYIKSIQNNTSLDSQTKAVLIYNARRDIKRWANTTAICKIAVEKLNSFAKTDDVDQDWVNLFEDLSSNVSNADFQEIWASILARECNEPGSVPKALLNVLAMMGRREAKEFQKLASFCIKIGGKLYPVIIYDKINDYYGEHGLALDAFNRLETLGLINLDRNELGGMALNINEMASLEYFDKKITVARIIEDSNAVKGKQASDVIKKIDSEGVARGKVSAEKTALANKKMIKLPIGSVMLSYIGEALMRHIVPEKEDGFFELATSFFKNPTQNIDKLFV